jgi:hypothetical protein
VARGAFVAFVALKDAVRGWGGGGGGRGGNATAGGKGDIKNLLAAGNRRAARYARSLKIISAGSLGARLVRGSLGPQICLQ